MPVVPFDTLPGDARVWVFASDRPLTTDEAAPLLAAVDAHLAEWRAHGAPLTCARAWRDNQFVAVGVDTAATGASGCSIDALFRTLQGLQDRLGTSLVGGGRVFFRDLTGAVTRTDRAGFARLAESGAIGARTPVFDPTVATVADWRTRFEVNAASAWHAALLPAGARA
jgi:hypothetical protein